MQRLIIAALLLMSGSWATAQTVKITTPTGTCTYSTGAVKSDPAVPGQLIATTSAAGSGTGCNPGGNVGAVSFGPANPLSPASSTLNATGGAQSLQFQPVNAVTCTASVSGGSSPQFSGGATSLQTCNSTATCANAQVIAPTFAANSTQNSIANTVTATCKDANNNSAVSTATVTVNGQNAPPPPGCATIPSATSGIASFTQWSGSVTANYFSGGNKVVDITQFASVYGAWPGAVETQTAAVTLPINKYVSLAFSVPAGYLASHPADIMGQYSLNQSAYSAPVSMTISTNCGDFSNPATNATSSVVPGCFVNLGTTGFAYLVKWAKSGSCTLTDGSTYYLNYINADITNAKPDNTGSITSSSNSRCNASGCTDGVTNGPGSW